MYDEITDVEEELRALSNKIKNQTYLVRDLITALKLDKKVFTKKGKISFAVHSFYSHE